MKHRILVAFAICGMLAALGGQASAALIIDENFDFNNLVDSGGSMVPVNTMMSMMWLRDMSAPFGMWMHTFDMGMLSPHVVGGMNMGMMSMEPFWRTLTYFVGMPRTGWQGNMLSFSFMYMYFSMNPLVTDATFGIYGWPADATIPLDSATPGMGGTELIFGSLSSFLVDVAEGGLMQEDGWETAGGTFLGDLSDFAFIGVTFTFGVSQGGAEAPEVRIDDVRLSLNAIPEPATLGLAALGMATAAWLARRRRRNAAGASGPPG